MRLALRGGLLLGVALGCWWPPDSSLAATNATVPSAPTASKPAPAEPGGGPRAVLPQPQGEAEALKKEAVAAADQAIEAYPNDALAFALLGSACYNTGRTDDAVKHLRKCLELDPGQAEACAVLALIAFDKGQLEECVRLCQEALQRGAAGADILNRLGRAYLDLGRTAEAIQTLQQAAGLPQPASESCYLLGQACLQSGDPARAKESLQRAIALQADHTQAHYALATACVRLGQTEEAARHRAQFQKLEAADRQALTGRGAQEETLTGLPMVRKTVARTFFGAGQVHQVHGQSGKAAAFFRKAATLDADSPTYRAALEAHYVRGKALADGVRAFKELVAEQPGNSLNHFFLGRLLGRLQQFEAAERAYLKTQELAPEWPEGYRALAELYLRAERKPAEARALARKVAGWEPSGPHFHLLAVACVKNHDLPGALQAMRRAVALSPGEKKYDEFLKKLQAAQ